MLWLTSAPPGLHRDEAVSLVDAWNLVQTGRDHMGHLLPLAAFEAYGDWTSPLLTYLQVPLVALAGPSPLVARLVTAIVGALAVPVVYALARSLRLPVAAAGCAALVCALSPWQIYLSRVAIPPALVPTCWGLCLLAAVLFVRDGRRRDALVLALAAGLALYAYPTMKLAVPLLLVITLVLALLRHGWRASAAWRLPALLLALLWLPFALDVLLNPLSGARFQEIGLTADSPAAWLAKWWHEYQVYLLPDFYYISGDARKIIRGVPGHGAALSVEAPLLLLGLAALALLIVARRRRVAPVPDADALPTDARLAALPVSVWWLILFAVLIAPLPASLTERNPNTFRAATITPLYALLVGMGAAVLWQCAARLPARWPAITRAIGAGVLVALLAWQSSAWYTDLVQRHAVLASGPFFFADGVLETMQRTVELAPEYDEIWLDTATIGRPYIYLLAAQPMPAAVAQAQTVVERLPLPPNIVSQIGRYHFADLRRLPANLPARELVLDQFARSGYILQQWQRDGRRLLLVRSISSLPIDDIASGEEELGGP
jgi:4-amino-4-deoxy-L-arabinose transferase-like glycosyltransferase